MPADQKYISFLDLARATIELPKTGEKSLFLAWAQTLLRDGPQGSDELQRKGLDLAERYWTYQDVRRGQKLEVLPVQDSKMQQWVSVARLMQTNWDDKTDATGEIRKAKAELQKARAAYLANAAEDFNAASANFIAALRKVGPQLGNYPSAEIIELEVAYNHWAPFRIAWVCTLLALLGVLLSWTVAVAAVLLGRPGLLWRRRAGHVGRLRHARWQSPGGRRSPICTNRWCSSASGPPCWGWCFNSSIANPMC